MVDKLDIPTTYSEINEAIAKEDHEKVVLLSDKILRANPKEMEAFQCNIIALINLGENDQILQTIDKHNLQTEYILEYSYALHEKKKYEESIKFLKDNMNKNLNLKDRIDELLAQNYYKLGKFDESYLIYKNLLIEKTNKETEEEDKDLFSNFLASYIYSKSNETDFLNSITKHLNSWESFYNYCIICIREGNFQESVEILNKMNIDYPNLDDEFNELKLMNLILNLMQLGFEGIDLSKFSNVITKYEKYFSQGKFQELNVYFYNNYIHIKKDKEALNEILKKLDVFLKNENLFEEEKKIILINKMILLLRANKIHEANEVLKQLDSNPNFSDPKTIIIYLYIVYKTEKLEKLESLLVTDPLLKKRPEAHLIYLQILLSNLNSANLESIHRKLLNFVNQFYEYTLNYHFLNFFIGFYESRHLKDNLKEFINSYKNPVVIFESLNKSKTQQLMIKNTLKILGNSFYYCGSFEESAKFYTYILDKFGKTDKTIKIDLINSFSHFNIEKAEELRRELDDTMIDISMENISNLLNEVFSKFKKNTQQQTKEKNKKKKKKKTIRYPKNFDAKNPGPMPDAERWVPKFQRKKYRNIAKNKLSYQGATTDNTTTVSTNKK